MTNFLENNLMKNNIRKTLIIDTSVLLYDKCAIHSFPGNDTIIPLVVLEELDRFKDKKGIVGENARYVNRYLDNLRKKGNLHAGITIENNQKIKVEITGFKKVPVGLDPTSVDNQIISLALILTQNEENKVILITKDINFRVKCDSLGIVAEDYHKDRIIKNESEFYKGYVDVEIEDNLIIDKLYEDGNSDSPVGVVKIVEEKIGRYLHNNEFVSIKCGSQSFLGCYFNNSINKIANASDLPGLSFLGIKERNREQLFALNLLFEEEVPLVSITGLAGSGKTFLTLMAGLAGLNEGKYKRIVITRNVQPVGRDIGFLPGDINEKMLPWMSPITDNFRQGLKDKDLTYFKAMKDKGQIEIAPLSFMRGRTFSDTFFIVDEAQNATIHELKTIVTRIGENSKIVLLGDIDQIDTPYIDSLSNGLTIVAEKFKNEVIAGHVQLKKGERSYLSAVAAKIL
jgi:PhoH-like ATPase